MYVKLVETQLFVKWFPAQLMEQFHIHYRMPLLFTGY